MFLERVEEVNRVCDDILCRKRKQYGTKNITIGGMFGLAVRLSDKVERMLNVCRNIERGEVVEFESLTDTIIDIRNYATIALLLDNGQWE